MSMPVKVSIPPEQLMMQMIHGKCISRCISLAADLSIADLLADGPRPVAALAAEAGVHPEPLYRVLRLLAAIGVFTESADASFGNNALSETLMSNGGCSVRNYARWFGRELHWRLWSGLDYSVRTRNPWPMKDHPGQSPFEALSGYPADQEVFNDAMSDLSAADGPAIVAAYDFGPFHRIVDVGGGHGALAALIAAKAPQASVAVFDLRHVVRDASERIAAGNGANQRIQFLPGSFFEALPTSADLFVLKHVLHDWDDVSARAILMNCRNSLEHGGRVLICEMVIEPGPQSIPGLILDIEMLAGVGGRERTEHEFARLLGESGLELRQILPTPARISVLEAAAI